jgi:hypothetical protein
VVLFYERGIPLEWGALVRRFLSKQVATQMAGTLRQEQDLPKTARRLLRPLPTRAGNFWPSLRRWLDSDAQLGNGGSSRRS